MIKRLANRMSTGRVVMATLLLLSFFSTSCINNHCNESIYSPLEIVFHSEVDTVKQVAPYFLAYQCVGATDSITNASGRQTLHLELRSDQEKSQFIIATAYVDNISPTELMIFDGENTFTGIDGSQHTLIRKNNTVYDFGEFSDLRFLAGAQDSLYVFLVPTFDTLTISHTNTIEFVSAECGCMNTHTIKSAFFEKNRIGSIIVNNSQVNNLTDAKHIKIYLENY